MTRRTSMIAKQFIARLERSAWVRVPVTQVGQVLAAFPVIGGGAGCILVDVKGMVVRLTTQDGVGIAEHVHGAQT